jgi:hypothetical protein
VTRTRAYRRDVELTPLGEAIEEVRFRHNHGLADVARYCEMSRQALNRARLVKEHRRDGAIGEAGRERIRRYLEAFGGDAEAANRFETPPCPDGLRFPAALECGVALRKPVEARYDCEVCRDREACAAAVHRECLAFCEGVLESELLSDDVAESVLQQWARACGLCLTRKCLRCGVRVDSLRRCPACFERDGAGEA